MSYVILSVIFVGAALIALAVALTTRTNARSLVHRWWIPVVVTAIALVVLTAVFDNVMIAAGLMVYGQETTTGLLIGLAPLEDFSYPIAGLILLPALWLLSRGRTRHER